MNIPRGLHVVDGKLKFNMDSRTDHDKAHFLKLKKNAYGLKKGGHLFWKKLKDGLIQRGFVQSQIDQYLFLRRDCIIVTYVDDCLFFAKDPKTIEELLVSLRKKIVLTDEGDVGNFLGIKVERQKNGSINLTQPGLIDKIIETVGLESNSSYLTTPSSGHLLTKDSEGEERKHEFDYRAAVGMIIYLTSSSRPELAFASHQSARFSRNPKRINEITVRNIGRYLHGTRYTGYFLNPNNTKNLDCYVDADFSGLWNPDEAQDPTTLKSRTGYVITFCGCPVIWASKLQKKLLYRQQKPNTLHCPKPCAILSQ
jgi:hypothetical protein